MAKKRKKAGSGPSLKQEVTGLAAIVLALFLVLCLVSFAPAPVDSGFDIQPNWGGAVGHLLATLLFHFFGVSAFWFPLILFSLGFYSFANRFDIQRLPYVLGGVSGLLLASSSLLASFNNSTIALFTRDYPLAGFIGNVLFSRLAVFLGHAGAILIFLAIFVFSIMAALRFSPYAMALLLLRGVGLILSFVRQKLEAKDDITKSRKKVKEPEPILPTAEDLPKVHEPVMLEEQVEDFQPLPVAPGEYQLPSMSLLDKIDDPDIEISRDHYMAVSKQLETTLNDFGVMGKVDGISPGPVITTYEFAPAPGVKINKVVNLADDLALALKAESVRIVGSIPGKAALGIEIPNPVRKNVSVRDIFATEKFQKSSSRLTIGLGTDVIGQPVIADLARMPHLLVAGATGAGKSVALNVIVASILYKSTPEEVRLLMIDPKRIEFSSYEDIPHLLHPVVVNPKMASRALLWAVKEMERRYSLMEEARVKSFASYNEVAEEKLPFIVVIIDELADLMMVSSNEVENSLARLAQMARAAGMHLILATQRPSVDVLTGLIKANFPTRMSFKVSSKVDSRTILDSSGAEHLLGSGDMLFLAPGTARLQRIHGAYISEHESERLVSFLKEFGTAAYDEDIIRVVEKEETMAEGGEEELDDRYDEAVAIVCESGQASISMVQRRLRVGYNRAARMIETMEREGVVGPADGAKPREVLVRNEY